MEKKGSKNVISSGQTPENDLIGKSVAGYQAWFRNGLDGPDAWHHWSGKTPARPGHLSFELFPDLREYPEEVMSETGFKPYPDGTPVRLFHSRRQPVIDIHFRWMREYGIDGVGIQRFYGDAKSTDLAVGAPHLTMIREAAEKYGRLYYVMYDVSGAGGAGAEALPVLQRDVIENLENRGIIASPSQAHADGRPVICLWGLSSRQARRYPGTAVMLPLVQWLKERGYYVIGGIPDNQWRDDTSDFSAVYEALDMISPWTVGRYNDASAEGWLERQVPGDMAYCAAHGQIYQPVLFPGFAWSSWLSGQPNATPRLSGSFMWKQARVYAKYGIRNLYFAMFDEYDEGTAIMKAAEDAKAIPEDSQYFQTLCADGKWLSSDFYLRLAGRITACAAAGRLLPEQPDIPYATGRVLWRNGFEQRIAWVKTTRPAPALPVLAKIDIVTNNAGIHYAHHASLMVAQATQGAEYSYSGQYGFTFSGSCYGGGVLLYRIAEADFTPEAALTIAFARKALTPAGGYVAVDVLFEDGTTLTERQPELYAGTQNIETGLWQQVRVTAKPEAGSVKAVLLRAAEVPDIEMELAGHFAVCIDDIEITQDI